MTQLSREDLHKKLKAATPAGLAPLYLLHGAEDYLRGRAARAITDAALADASLREFNDNSFDLSRDDVQQATGTASQLPMMASRRVVRVSDFSKLREADEEALIRYLTRPAAETVMIFTADELDKRRRVSKLLLDKCECVEFPPLADAELTTWARRMLKNELQTEADDVALRQIILLAGPSVRRVANELGKLATAALPARRITSELVDQLALRSREHSNFELGDQLLAGERARALATLRLLIDDGAEPVMLLGLIASHYHRLALAKDLMARGAPNEQVARTLALHFSKREQFLGTARRADERDLTRALARIADADIAIKTSRGGSGTGGARQQLELLICELLPHAARAGA